MISSKNLYIGAALGLVLAAGTGFGIARLTAPTAEAPVTNAQVAAGPVDTVAITADGIAESKIAVAPASATSLSEIVLASATVGSTPDSEAVLTARAAGTITRIFKRIGDAVRAGETVALVESRDASSISADRRVAAARTTLAARQLAREKSLLAQGVSPRADYETAEASLAVARAELQQADAAARAARVSGDGRSVAVVSSVSGRITSATASLGSYVQAETELFRAADPRGMQIEASVPASDAQRIRPGDRVELITSEGKTIAGRVRSSTGTVDGTTRQATIIIAPAGASEAIAPGQMIEARIFASGRGGSAGVTIPQEAVQTLGGRTVVFVRTSKGFVARDVQVSGRSGGMVAIGAGLEAKTMIATTNAFLLKAELEKETAE
ncbi:MULTISPECIES: efflux RND transporter periplasmic adaptor subunit [Sphingomonadaceae]|jgi:cobalt-zinc-cadmium efflux system membrane fusion protein|uniref:Efflux RND transporter periplasmic adaptor subunit n=2 Tax=Sphingomonadaceae TaxID=41297 RepID=A0A7X4GI42_9SPHN|nr:MULTISPECIES: efflux RND transporter periplasmic adaptor subunit [Sphingomonadaceae]MBU64710.1 efflux RND transporter periplasmic adaptor subunit [Cupriavidus sp.]MCC4253777.1 efflux RND transporter periplasmic adaptor subunit [Sphingobium naphthae]KEZ12188.1 Efflux transporter, RND family, MFP subunit [Sphingobium yanoikuyae]KZC75552.1 efflux transporter periplasmic adaptor subunit [Sphingobium yanoikuyae]MDG5973164.1 efflux RND transporter periplasmic adaptor subunit [Sphingomonas paucimo